MSSANQPLVSIVSKSTADFDKVKATMRAAGMKEMKPALRKIVTEETKPTRKKIKQSALDTLPQKGGLNKFAAITPQGKADFRPKYASIKIRAEKRGHDLRSLNKGRLRHPLFGNRRKWYQQDIAPGFFDKPINDDAAELKRRIIGAMDALFDRIRKDMK